MRTAIVIRTKNRPLLLARALKDVSSQRSHEWELVVVNDGGDPAEVEHVLEEHRAALAGRATVIHNERSRGMEAAANQGVGATTAPYLVIHDDDDTWAPDFLVATAAALDADPALVGVVARTDIVVEVAEGDTFREIERRPFVPPHDVITLYDLIIMNRAVPISLLIRRSALEEIGPFDETLPVVGDWDMNMRLTAHGDVAYLADEVRAHWHQRPEASGAASNSVFSGDDLHAKFDRIVRERALRSYVQEHGMGALLYLARHVQDVAGANSAAIEMFTARAVQQAQHEIIAHLDHRFDELERRMSTAADEQRERSLGSRVRRWVGRAAAGRRSR